MDKKAMARKPAGARGGRGSLEVPNGIAGFEPQEQQAGRKSEAPTVEDRIEGFAEDLGRFLGATQVKASAWMDQRKVLLERLTQVRDTATSYINQLGGGTSSGRGRKPGRPRKIAPEEGQFAPAPLSKKQRRKKRTMSPEAREKIAAAQRARWAKQKRAAKG